MPEPALTVRQLPRGRHGLPRETVVQSQRERILSAMAEVMAESGYVKTSVAMIIKRARVSRETFYEQFRSKEDCFEAAYERAVELLIAGIEESTAAQADSPPPSGAARLDRILHAYLEGLAVEPAYARLYLVEVYAAGAQAIARRMLMQESFAALLWEALGAHTEEQRFACQTLVAAISALVTARIAADDLDGLRALREPLVDMVRRGGELYGSTVS
ncbi:TetR/AcrR family transcriptional regulator [Nocardia sp. CDC159]|uniref:TetR/AcrR family transcriptional regulator n=1 Tax=Nocardia pulmonis TaxID=2951408 RepID=A0A9X2E9R9_9NOCA|nr:MULTISPECIES: TetR/AcrR family transcriptional regulator [Nocardia]MCM6776907.1 TetR/AcrR family transcriptional regulator [Nocardia pulmonis]MCM6789331.1 TetR/AcrR family transcriptional regulator [Nocardia sp. CDC159]